MWIKRPVPADLSLEPEALCIGGNQELNRRSIEANAVVETLHAVFGVNPLDGHHRHQHLDIGDSRRIASKERLDMMRRWTLNHMRDPVAGDIDSRHATNNLIDLRDHDTVFEGGRFYDEWRVFGVGTGVEIALRVGRLCGDERNARRKIDKIAAEELEVGVNRANGDSTVGDELGKPGSLRPGKGKVELACDTPFEQIQMLRQSDDRLDHVQVMHDRGIDSGQRLSEEVSLFLVIAFQTHAIAWLDNTFQQFDDVLCRDKSTVQAIAESTARTDEALLQVLCPLVPPAEQKRRRIHRTRSRSGPEGSRERSKQLGRGGCYTLVRGNRRFTSCRELTYTINRLLYARGR